jgi:hypothetical protein
VSNFSSRGLIKNKPALGEQALHELVADNLLKYNYFLTGDRDRKLKSYMKIPIPAVTDPAREQLMNSLSKHGINFYDYSSAYEKSSIPPNYTLSKLTIEIFERNSYFVPEYPKYKNQLKDVIQKHLGNGSIREIEESHYIVQNQDAFTYQFQEIENLVTSIRSENIHGKRQSANLTDQATKKPTIQITTADEVNVPHNTVERNREIQCHDWTETSGDQHGVDIGSENYSLIYQLPECLCHSF